MVRGNVYFCFRRGCYNNPAYGVTGGKVDEALQNLVNFIAAVRFFGETDRINGWRVAKRVVLSNKWFLIEEIGGLMKSGTNDAMAFSYSRYN